MSRGGFGRGGGGRGGGRSFGGGRGGGRGMDEGPPSEICGNIYYYFIKYDFNLLLNYYTLQKLVHSCIVQKEKWFVV